MPPKFSKLPHPDASPQDIEAWKLQYFSAYNNNNSRKRQHPADEADEVNTKRNADLQQLLQKMEEDPGYTGYQNAAKVRLENTENTKGTRPFFLVADIYAKILKNHLEKNPFFKSLIALRGEVVANVEMCKHWNLSKCSANGSHYPKTVGGLGLSRIHGCAICYLATGAIFGHRAIECKLLRDLDKIQRNEAKLRAQKQRQQDARILATAPASTSGPTGNTTKGTPSPPTFYYNKEQAPATGEADFPVNRTGSNDDPIDLVADDADQLADQMDNTSMS